MESARLHGTDNACFDTETLVLLTQESLRDGRWTRRMMEQESKQFSPVMESGNTAASAVDTLPRKRSG